MEIKVLMHIYDSDVAIYAAVVDSIELAKAIANSIVKEEIEWNDYVPYITCKPETNVLEQMVNVPRWVGEVWRGKKYDEWSVPDVAIAISEIRHITTEDVEYIQGLQS